jgi:transposase
MKDQPSNQVGPRGRHANHSQAYIQEALELWRTSGRSATVVAAELGIRRPLLYRWAAAQRRATDTPQLPAPARAARSVAELEAEIRRLREENEKLLEQREILKKSLGIFSEPPPRGMPKSKP